MLDGMKFAEQNMLNLSQKQDVITNNLANAGTYGYRKEAYNVVSFSEVLKEQSGMLPFQDEETTQPYMKTGGGMDSRGALLGFTTTSYNQGALKQTGNTFDMSLDDNGMGFFTVKTPQGELYTRAGNFRLMDGCLVTSDGARLQGMKGDIRLNGTNFEVTNDGYVKMDGQVVDRLKISTFLDRRCLQKAGQAYFTAPKDKAIVLDQGLRVKQGYLEMPNINTVTEMVEMMTVMRNFEASQKVLQAEDHLIQKSTEVGKVR